MTRLLGLHIKGSVRETDLAWQVDTEVSPCQPKRPPM